MKFTTTTINNETKDHRTIHDAYIYLLSKMYKPGFKTHPWTAFLKTGKESDPNWRPVGGGLFASIAMNSEDMFDRLVKSGYVAQIEGYGIGWKWAVVDPTARLVEMQKTAHQKALESIRAIDEFMAAAAGLDKDKDKSQGDNDDGDDDPGKAGKGV